MYETRACARATRVRCCWPPPTADSQASGSRTAARPRQRGLARGRRPPLLREAIAQLGALYFAGERTHFELPLDLQAGTPFQQSVWSALLAIPPPPAMPSSRASSANRRRRGPSAPPWAAIP